MKRTRNSLRLSLITAVILALPTSVLAHRIWIVPSTTVLSGEGPWITVDAAISNDLFFPNHHAVALSGITVTGPDGASVPMQHTSEGEIRSTFELQLEQEGTYRIAQVRDGYFATWTEDGERRRWRGSREELKESDLPQKLGFRAMARAGRVESFVTLGTPSTEIFEPVGAGLELVPETHPNDLFSGETARFRLLLNGHPAAGVLVTAIRGQDRYRDRVDAIEVTTDAEGGFELQWPEPGRYWLHAETETEAAAGDFDFPVSAAASYTAVLEVLPY